MVYQEEEAGCLLFIHSDPKLLCPQFLYPKLQTNVNYFYNSIFPFIHFQPTAQFKERPTSDYSEI